MLHRARIQVRKLMNSREYSEAAPYISAATMLGVEVTDPEEHTYTKIVDAIRVHGADARADIEELLRRIAFSILLRMLTTTCAIMASCMKIGNSVGCRLPLTSARYRARARIENVGIRGCLPS
jgi:hypothetical protein